MLGIIIALNIFLIVTRSLFLVEPEYQTFCPASSYTAPQTVKECVAIGGSWTGVPAGPAPAGATVPSGYCDVTSKCQKQYDIAHQQFALYSFIFTIAFGVIAIIIGVMPLGSAIVSAGLSYGGVLAFVVAAIEYWGDAGNILRFGISFIALAALIYLGLKRFRD